MDKLKNFLQRRTSGELTLILIIAGILLFAAGTLVGNLLYHITN